MDSTEQTQLDKIMEALDFEEMTPDEQKQIMLDLSDLIFRGTMVRLMEIMEPSTKDEFHKLIDSNASQQKLSDFIEANVPGSDDVVRDTINDLTSDILSVTAQ